LVESSDAQEAIDNNRDVPMPSVEQDASYDSSRASTGSTMKYDSIQTETEALHALRLTSSELSQSPSQLQYVSMPSICVSKLDTVNDLPGRSDSVMKGLDALCIKDHRSTTVSGSSEVNKCSSPSLSLRRRFASAVSMRHHRVEDEDPPQSPFHMPEV
jgi:hypothetical protein